MKSLFVKEKVALRFSKEADSFCLNSMIDESDDDIENSLKTFQNRAIPTTFKEIYQENSKIRK